MDFYYHPILGLQMTFGFKSYEMDLEATFTTEDFLRIFRSKGVSFIDSAENKNSITVIPRIISNVN
jgi:hypothetical protein